MKKAVVTGANSGLGKVTAKELLKEGYEVVLVCRNKEKGEAILKELQQETPGCKAVLMLCELSSIKAVKALAEEIKSKYNTLDLLVNNAGAYNSGRKTTVDGYELTLAANHLAYFQLADELLPLLKAASSARIVNVASAMESGAQIKWDDLNLTRVYSGWNAYSQSKRFNIMFTMELAERLKDTNVTVNAMHPGGVHSNFGKNIGGVSGFAYDQMSRLWKTPEQGADTILWLATSPEVEKVSGKYFIDRAERQPSAFALDKANRERLWEISEKMIADKLN